jgi:predicted nucleotide-binding protein
MIWFKVITIINKYTSRSDMNPVSVAMAKLSGVRTVLLGLLKEEMTPSRPRLTWEPTVVQHYFRQVEEMLKTLQRVHPMLFEDFQLISVYPAHEIGSPPRPVYTRSQLDRLCMAIDQIFEIRANSELSVATPAHVPSRRVFITHGRSNDWREVQAYLERDLQLSTMELAQESSQGMTIIEKLLAGADRCDSAVIVMTGDDRDMDGQVRSRENVMHEIGFFQGKYGRSNVVLLHEEGVSIPTNLAGIVYVPYPKETIAAALHVLGRELKVLYG